jgi:hypothetical protein
MRAVWLLLCLLGIPVPCAGSRLGGGRTDREEERCARGKLERSEEEVDILYIYIAPIYIYIYIYIYSPKSGKRYARGGLK